MYIPSFPTYLSVYILTKKVNLYQAVGFNIVKITCATFFVNVFKKMAAGSHFGCPKSLLTISDQYHNFYFVNFFTKWPPAPILDVRNSLSIAFLAILDQCEILFLFGIVLQNGCCRPFWMTEIHDRISGHFR